MVELAKGINSPIQIDSSVIINSDNKKIRRLAGGFFYVVNTEPTIV